MHQTPMDENNFTWPKGNLSCVHGLLARLLPNLGPMVFLEVVCETAISDNGRYSFFFFFFLLTKMYVRFRLFYTAMVWRSIRIPFRTLSGTSKYQSWSDNCPEYSYDVILHSKHQVVQTSISPKTHRCKNANYGFNSTMKCCCAIFMDIHKD